MRWLIVKEIYITDSEREKCRKVANAFAELYEIENILVVDAGRYGFVKLQYYRPPQGFEDAITFNDVDNALKTEELKQKIIEECNLYFQESDKRWNMMMEELKKLDS